MGSNRVGTKKWADATGGSLGIGDRLALLGQLAMVVGGLPGVILRRSRPIASGNPVGARVRPRVVTEAMRRAEAICCELVPEYLRCHSYRTYAWARTLVALDGISNDDIDDEVLYVSCLMHDVGLATTQRSFDRPGCFTLTGAQALRGITTGLWEEERISQGEEAITLHMNLRVPPSQGIAAHLLSRASQLEALGLGLWKVSKADRERVFSECPLDPAQKRGISDLFRRSRHARKSRARMYSAFGSTWLFRHLGLRAN